MSNERPQRKVKRQNYKKLHSSGHESGSDRDADVNAENNRIVLVEDTPCPTPVELNNSNCSSTNIIPETQVHSPVQGAVMDSIQDEISEAEIRERQKALEKEQRDIQKRAEMLTVQMQLEAKERHVAFLKTKVEKLMEARKAASEGGHVFNPKAAEGDETVRKMEDMLEMLQREEQERERVRKEEVDRIQRQKEEDEAWKEKSRKEKEAEEKGNTGEGDKDPTMKKVLDWIAKQEAQQKEEEAQKERLKGLQAQIENMTKTDNQRTCQMTGVNLFSGLDAIQGDGETAVDLAAKVQQAMIAATTKRRREEEEESEGESINSNNSKKRMSNFKSGLASVSAQKVRVEVEWAHHWLGKEFEANPVSFNQLKLGHFMSGELEILLHCDRPVEFRARLKLMGKMGYWAAKYDWPQDRSIYAAILRGIETGRETWNFDPREYASDMLSTVVQRPTQSVKDRDRDTKRPRDFFFCAPFQKGECSLDAPHLAQISVEGGGKNGASCMFIMLN